MRFARSITAGLLGGLVLTAAGAGSAAAASKPVIVVLKPGASLAVAQKRHGAVPTHTFQNALNGYAAVLGDVGRARAAADPAVLFIADDRPVTIAGKAPGPAPGQTIPTGIRRSGANDSNTARIDGVDSRVNVDVAVIDTGIDLKHPQLSVAGGVNCSAGTTYSDGNGHGTHVAGTIAALDDRAGVVGMAPGARLWAVRVLNNAGSGTTSSVVCGIDWVTANAEVIDVANMSLGGPGTDDEACGRVNNDPMHVAICASVAAGVVYAVAAGNESANSAGSTPAAYDEVITVSAIADFNGDAGGGALATCRADVDDTFADFSNFGSDVDIAAPGTCILSTWKGAGYNTISGTSMASPHVAGALALYVASFPLATPADAKAALLAVAEPGPIAGDPDIFKENLLRASSL